MSKILIIEDDIAIAEIERDYLEINGFEVKIETDGVSGMNTALKGGFQLVLLDLMLPEIDGFTVCRSLREHLDIPILMVTAKKEDIDKVHIVGISLGAVLAQDFANQFPKAVQSLACFGGYDINNFDAKMQKGNSAAQLLMMLKAVFSTKWFAKSNKKISAYTEQAQKDFYEMNIGFPKRSFMYLASLNAMVNVRQATPREYPLLIGCGQHDIPMELSAVEMLKKNEPECKVVIFEGAGHCVNMDVPQQFNKTLAEFWSGGN